MDDLETFRLFLDGKGVDALSGRTFESMNPYTGRPWARLADGGPEDVDAAVASARAAFDGEWGALTGFQRAAVLRACGTALEAAAERPARRGGGGARAGGGGGGGGTGGGKAGGGGGGEVAAPAAVVLLLRRAGRQ